jgi:hypothetical protein
VGESIPLQVSVDRYILCGQVLVQEPLQRRLQRGIETRDRPVISVLAIAACRQAARCVRDAEGDHLGHGIVSPLLFLYSRVSLDSPAIMIDCCR